MAINDKPMILFETDAPLNTDTARVAKEAAQQAYLAGVRVGMAQATADAALGRLVREEYAVRQSPPIFARHTPKCFSYTRCRCGKAKREKALLAALEAALKAAGDAT